MQNPTEQKNSMNVEDRLKAAQSSLALVLGFFPRIETKLSVVLSLNLAMAAFLSKSATTIEHINNFGWVSIIIYLVFLAYGLVQVYRGSFPSLDGGTNSLIYFREIASQIESRFVEHFSSMSQSDLTTDYLGQTWRNSKILTVKFDCLKKAYQALLLSIFPWAISLVIFLA